MKALFFIIIVSLTTFLWGEYSFDLSNPIAVPYENQAILFGGENVVFYNTEFTANTVQVFQFTCDEDLIFTEPSVVYTETIDEFEEAELYKQWEIDGTLYLAYMNQLSEYLLLEINQEDITSYYFDIKPIDSFAEYIICWDGDIQDDVYFYSKNNSIITNITEEFDYDEIVYCYGMANDFCQLQILFDSNSFELQTLFYFDDETFFDLSSDLTPDSYYTELSPTEIIKNGTSYNIQAVQPLIETGIVQLEITADSLEFKLYMRDESEGCFLDFIPCNETQFLLRYFSLLWGDTTIYALGYDLNALEKIPIISVPEESKLIDFQPELKLAYGIYENHFYLAPIDINQFEETELLDLGLVENYPFDKFYHSENVVYFLDKSEEGYSSIASLKYNGVNNEDIPQVFDYSIRTYPNPFTQNSGRNSNIAVEFELSKDEQVNLSIYNIKGQHIQTICNEKLFKGKHIVNWDMKNKAKLNVSNGVYLLKLKTKTSENIKKLTIIK
jgi:hypothetical protein